MKIQRDMLLKKKTEERQKEVEEYQKQKSEVKTGISEEESKNERIKKGMAALNIGGTSNN